MKPELADLQNLYNILIEFTVKYSFQIIGALIILFVGIKLAGWLSGLVIRLCEKHGLDITLAKFIGNLVKILSLAFVIIITIGQFGISIAPLIAAVSALAFGASFAIQGPLSNYGAGLSIILSRPFVVGNTITVNGVTGIVEDIRLAATVLSTEDGEQITIPNKHIVGEVIHNSFANKVVEFTVGISYADDPAQAIEIIRGILSSNPDIATEPLPQIGIDAFADSAINIGMRYWIPTAKYFQTRFLINGAIHKELLAGGITIPFPQRQITILEKEEGK